jgi:hypothetical protein
VHEACYELCANDRRDLTRQLIASSPIPFEQPQVCFRLDGLSEFSDIGRSLEVEVFRDAFEGNDESFFYEQYGRYDASSVFFVTVDVATAEPLGVLRAITPSRAGLKTVNDLERLFPGRVSLNAILESHRIADLEDIWDVGTVGVPRRFRSSAMATSIQLYRALYVSMMHPDAGARYMISVIDERALRQLKSYLGIPLAPLLGLPPFSYLGSPISEAVVGDTEQFFRIMKRRASIVRVAATVARRLGIPPKLGTSRLSSLAGALDRLVHGSGGTDASLAFDTSHFTGISRPG